MQTSYSPSFNGTASRATTPYHSAQQVQGPNVFQKSVDAVDQTVDDVKKKMEHSGIWNLVILVVVLTLVYMLLFWLLKIPIVLNTNAAGALTSDVSFWKLFATSFIGSLLTTFVIWGFSKLTGRK